MSQPAVELTASEWPYDSDDGKLQPRPIAGQPWSDARFEELWGRVNGRNGAMLHAVAAAETEAAAA